MEVLGVALGVILLVVFVAAPFVALAYASGARKRVAALQVDSEARERELRWLYDKAQALERRLATLEARPPQSATSPATAPSTSSPTATTASAAPDETSARTAPSAIATLGAHDATADAADAYAPTRTADELAAARVASLAAAESGDPASPVHGSAEPVTDPARPVRRDGSEDATIPPIGPGPRAPRADTPPLRPPVPVEPPPPPVPFEQRMAAWLTRLGAGIALLGGLYFFKYAVDSDLIGPAGRVLVGVLAGVVLLVAAEVLRKTTQAAFLQILVGLGLAILFASSWAGSVLYELIPITAGFIANAVILLVGAALAWHHRAQAILVLALVATFLNPVLLSTGHDRPLALFGYLLLFTGVMGAVAVRLRFAVALAVAILGVLALFMGWYDRYFDIHDSRDSGVDMPPEQLLGPYFTLAARAVPLGAVVLFSAQWLTAAFALKRDGASQRWTVPLALAALLAAHAGFAALLPDAPLALGAAMIVAGAAAIVSLHALGRTDLLMVPMVAAFLILAAQLPEVPAADHRLVLLVLGAWTAVYVGAFLRTASREHEVIERGPAIRGAISLAVFAVLAALLLLPSERTTALALVVMAVALGIVVLAYRAGLVALGIAGLVGGLLLLGVTVETHQRVATTFVDWPLLGVLVVWALIHAGGVLWSLARGRPAHAIDLASLSASTLSLVLLVFGATSDEVPTLRALFTALAGAADLGMAAWISRARPDVRSWVSILAAQALGLFAVSLAFALSGATVSLVWAALAFVAALLWAHERTPTWATALGVLVTATLVRVLVVDVAETQDLLSSYRWTQGRQGIYELAPFLNARALALLGSGVALLVSALVLVRADRREAYKPLRSTAGVLATIGHLLLITLFIGELRALVLELPTPPSVVLDAAEFAAFWESVDAARLAQYSKVNMVSTVTLAVAAMVLLAIGFAFKDAFHRYLALAVFGLTIAKLIGWDVWNLARTYQIIVLTVVGALLLGSGFMYARLRSLFTGSTPALLVLVGLVFGTSVAEAAPPLPTPLHPYLSRRSVEGVTAPGDYRLVLDAATYAASQAERLLEDLRVVGPDGMGVPYVLRTVEPDDPTPSRDGSLYDPGSREGGYMALFEVPAGPPHCRVELGVTGPAPYLRRVDVDGGETTDDLRLLASNGVVYAIDSDNGVVSSTSLSYPRSVARWVRITLRPDREARETTITGARFYACTSTPREAARETIPLTLVGTTHDTDKHTTTIELDVGAEGLPLERLTLDVTTSEFVRRVDLAASSHKGAWPYVTSGYVYRVLDAQAPEDTTALVLSTPLRKRWLRVTIHDGDDAPLSVRGATGELTRRELVLRASSAGPHSLYLGDKAASAPSYDLADILARRTVEQPLVEARLGPVEPNPDHGKPTVPSALPLTEQYRGPIGIGLSVLLLALALWAIRLVRSRGA